MQRQKTKSLWVSHSSIGDYLKCPRLYFLRNVYKDPKTGNKINIVSPALSLGQIVHQVLESLSLLKAEDRFTHSLIDKYNKAWEQISGKQGGFVSEEQELEFKNRGAIMINRVMFHPGPLENKALKLTSPDSLPPRFLLSPEDDIILCGKIDWLEYIPETDSVHIIDFKTGMNEEKDDSLQLPIYMLLVTNCQKRKVSSMSYWYLENQNEPKRLDLPDLEASKEKILTIARKIKQARIENNFLCPKNGCYHCRPFEEILQGHGELIGTTDYQDLYILPKHDSIPTEIPEDLVPF